MDQVKLRQQVNTAAADRDGHLNETIPKTVAEEQDQKNDAIAMSTISHNKHLTMPSKNEDSIMDKQISISQPGQATSIDQKRKLPNNRPPSIDQPQFIEALSAPRKWLNHITIEPLAFIAILALYIEFPSIQDLIYTKICLQVVTNNPNFTQLNNNQQPTLTIDNPASLTNLTTRITRNGSITHSTNSELYSRALEFEIGERSKNISLLGNLINPESTTNNTTTSGISNRAHFLCDRFDKSAIPAHIRQEIAAGDSLFWLKYQLIICLLCTISCPYWGGMSDKIGRLIPLNVPIVVAVLSNMISLIYGLLISMNWHDLVQVEWLYLGAVLTGLSGGQAVVIIGSFSFISDNTNSESRSRRVTVLESVIYLSHSVGFFLNKFIMSLGLESLERPWCNRHIVAFSLCAILNLICVLYSIIKLRHHKFHRFMNNFEREHYETFTGDSVVTTTATSTRGSRFDTIMNHDGLSTGDTSGVANVDRPRELTSSTPDDLDGPIVRSDKRWSDWGTILTFKYYKQTYVTATKRRETRTLIQLLLLCGFISAMSLACLLSLLYIYVRSDPFNWNTSQYSWWNTITSVTRGVALVGLTLCMKLIDGWNIPDPLLAIIGFLSKGVGLLMIALAQSSSIINWALLAFVLSEFSMPPIRSLLSKLVAKEEVGKVYSCLAAMQSICFLFGNIVFYLAYTSLELEDFFRLCFLVVASFQFAAIIIMLVIYTSLRSRVMLA